MSRPADKRQKARFPVGRIKRIMQMDEDVGKVAQATPLLLLNHPRAGGATDRAALVGRPLSGRFTTTATVRLFDEPGEHLLGPWIVPPGAGPSVPVDTVRAETPTRGPPCAVLSREPYYRRPFLHRAPIVRPFCSSAAQSFSHMPASRSVVDLLLHNYFCSKPRFGTLDHGQRPMEKDLG
ncbi:MAG: hypothetical protein BJ554DRAFT_7946 [Olpidium bornovanus]|uniref:Transcription factor CBF/NF-Y/archaeal histone domain-containing protein n=1 Tax=Olpidium bornovanus TaxID=278681 RepID=A0A8H7ZVR2_9FUNG|nr:MAG: hypothetical protein BJ554DRAFT_7946 [Olpidium bornovanus]